MTRALILSNSDEVNVVFCSRHFSFSIYIKVLQLFMRRNFTICASMQLHRFSAFRVFNLLLHGVKSQIALYNRMLCHCRKIRKIDKKRHVLVISCRPPLKTAMPFCLPFRAKLKAASTCFELQ